MKKRDLVDIADDLEALKHLTDLINNYVGWLNGELAIKREESNGLVLYSLVNLGGFDQIVGTIEIVNSNIDRAVNDILCVADIE